MKSENYLPTITDRLKQAVYHLKKEHRIKNQVDLAAKMGISPITVSRALSGTYKGEKFAQDLNSIFDFMFSISWLLYGKGDMLAHSKPEPMPEPQELKPQEPSIPGWADSLIQLVSTNTQMIEQLRAENRQLREDLNRAIAALNSLHGTPYPEVQAPMFMAAEPQPSVSPSKSKTSKNQKVKP